MDVAEVRSGPLRVARTIAASSTVRVNGPIRSRLGVSGIAPAVGIRPKVARSPTMPHRSAGLRMEHRLSVPMENEQSPAAVAEPGPVLEPPAGSSGFQGLRQVPPNQVAPLASAAVASLPRR